MATSKRKTGPHAKAGKKITGSLENISVARGSKKAPPAKGDVAAHSKPLAYHCRGCWALNYIPAGAEYFLCWRCGTLNMC
ncbi:MAG TPA: hypothetical protein VLV49_03900 [Terriglobales bacterium]|nr:hypothetical protein [Terriglobales bacterium]